MKKIISILALLSVFTLNVAQEKEGCCAGKDKKHCSTADKKADAEYHKGCEKKESTAQNNAKAKNIKEKKQRKPLNRKNESDLKVGFFMRFYEYILIALSPDRSIRFSDFRFG